MFFGKAERRCRDAPSAGFDGNAPCRRPKFQTQRQGTPSLYMLVEEISRKQDFL
jgi:hypothetical protein